MSSLNNINKTNINKSDLVITNYKEFKEEVSTGKYSKWFMQAGDAKLTLLVQLCINACKQGRSPADIGKILSTDYNYDLIKDIPNIKNILDINTGLQDYMCKYGVIWQIGRYKNRSTRSDTPDSLLELIKFFNTGSFSYRVAGTDIYIKK
jgi:hypothetical protein